MAPAGRSLTRAAVIVNSASRNGTARAVLPVLRVLRTAGWRFEVATAADPTTIRRFAAEAVDQGPDVVVAIGGDGTVTTVAGPLIGTGIALGIIPAGTGNLLAGNLGIGGHLEAATRTLVSGRPRPIDLGSVERGGTARHFAIACGVGFDAEVIRETHPERKQRWGKLAYFTTAVALLPRLSNAPYSVTIDGQAREFEAAEVLVANVGSMVRGLRPRLAIRPDDGLLDVTVVAANGPLMGLLAIVEAFSQAEHGRHPGGRVFRARGRRIRIEAQAPAPVELDGDAEGTTPIEIEVLNRAISVIVPRR